MNYQLPHSQIPVQVDFDVEAVHTRYTEELAKRSKTNAPGKAHRPGAVDPAGGDPWSTVEPRGAVQEECEVLIIGGGFSGLTLGGKLTEAGIDSIRILEHGGDFGGVWYWNRYPNAQCDIESYVYFPLLEETGYMPSSKYPPATEIYEYAQHIGKHFNLYDKALFHTAATRASWDEQAQRWIVATDRGDEIHARYLIRSSGALGTPVFPNVPGIETFPGRIFHSSRWDYEYTGGSQFEPLVKLRNKKVVVVGSGASAVQVVAALAGQVEHLYVVQRTPGPAVGERDATPTNPEKWKDLSKGWQRERMLNYDANTSGHPQPVDLVQDQFSRLFSTNATANNIVDDLSQISEQDLPVVFKLADMKIMEQVRSACDEIVEDPGISDQLKPWYGFGCKRVTFDDGYLAAFNRDDVTLIDAPVTGLQAIHGSTVCAGGQEFEADCIILATGFDAGSDPKRRTGVTVTGKGGIDLSEHWSRGLRTLHGFMSDNFPNLFETGQGQGAIALNFTSLLRLQAEHIVFILSEARKQEATVVEPTPQAVEAWGQRVYESGAPFRAYHANCVPGYYNGYGRGDGVLTSQVFTEGIHSFRRVLEDWRATGEYAGLTFS